MAKGPHILKSLFDWETIDAGEDIEISVKVKIVLELQIFKRQESTNNTMLNVHTSGMSSNNVSRYMEISWFYTKN
jgi:hypothetical protein